MRVLVLAAVVGSTLLMDEVKSEDVGVVAGGGDDTQPQPQSEPTQSEPTQSEPTQADETLHPVAKEAELEPAPDPIADACKAGTPRVAVIAKYNDRLPVQLANQAHLDR